MASSTNKHNLIGCPNGEPASMFRHDIRRDNLQQFLETRKEDKANFYRPKDLPRQLQLLVWNYPAKRKRHVTEPVASIEQEEAIAVDDDAAV
tara:strand:- start:78 stop:353 length:276 start_codon:yes stop_codon:yes gene_type:complete